MSRSRILKQILRYGVAGHRPASPPTLIFHVTARCDLKCRHCSDDVWGDPAKDLSLAEIEAFSAGLGPVEMVALGGGEPFLRRDLAAICELFVRNNGARAISIPSNGSATEAIVDTVLRILKSCQGIDLHISLSLDGFRETHDSIRAPGSFDRVMATAQRLKPLTGTFPNLAMTFNATINNLNWRELPELARFVQDRFGAELQFNTLSGNPRDPALGLPAREDLKRTIDGIYAARQRSAVTASFLNTYRDLVLETIFEKRQAAPCRAGSLICLVDANGDVRACPLLPPIGNVRDSSFRDIWQNEAARRQHRSIRRGSCACSNDCFTGLGLVYYWKLPFLMLLQLIKRQN